MVRLGGEAIISTIFFRSLQNVAHSGSVPSRYAAPCSPCLSARGYTVVHMWPHGCTVRLPRWSEEHRMHRSIRAVSGSMYEQHFARNWHALPPCLNQTCGIRHRPNGTPPAASVSVAVWARLAAAYSLAKSRRASAAEPCNVDRITGLERRRTKLAGGVGTASGTKLRSGQQALC